MKLCVIGRTAWLLEAARRLHTAGHTISCVVTAKHSPESDATADDFRDFADSVKAGFFRTVKSDNPALLDALGNQSADLAISMNFPGIMGPQFIESFRLGVLNCHGSLLPKYRGNACPNWAILNGEETTGLTIHKVVPDELDSGDILLQKEFPIIGGADITDVYQWYGEAVPDAFVEAVSGLADGSIASRKQDSSQATYCYPRRPEDGRLDFNLPAPYLARLVRASSKPFSGAFCFLDGNIKVTVWRATALTVDPFVHAVPGQILHHGPEGIVVHTAEGRLRLEAYDAPLDAQFGRRRRLL